MIEDLRLYKFSKRKHICSLIHEGKLCLTPISKYGEKGLSKGAFDSEELSFFKPCQMVLSLKHSVVKQEYQKGNLMFLM